MATAVVLLSVPVMAALSSLRSLPLGRGSATVTWTGKSGVTPTISSIHGSAHGFAILATGRVPTYTGVGTGASGSTPSSLPASLPLADIEGTIGGTAFTLDVTLNLSGLDVRTNKPVVLGRVTGSFRGQPITAVLSARLTSPTVSFNGTIGSDHITGTIGRVVRHGETSTAPATYDVSR